MSQHKLVSTIMSELEELNSKIDWKVIRGVSYKADARRHKLLLSMLRDVRSHGVMPSRLMSFHF